MWYRITNRFWLFALFVFASCATRSVAGGKGADSQAPQHGATPEEVRAFFRGQNKRVLTFIGYSGAGYEDPEAMMAHARAILQTDDPDTTLVNIGATPEGIGAVYELAKRLGFVTTGVVSSVARTYQVEVSPHVDHVIYVEDTTWGGFQPGTQLLSPTSRAMVENSDVLVAIGGGEIGRDELISAQRLSKPVQFIAAEMNHRKALDEARKKGRPDPTDFSGAAHAVFGPKASRSRP